MSCSVLDKVYKTLGKPTLTELGGAKIAAGCKDIKCDECPKNTLNGGNKNEKK